jgi:hypothetical protein
MVEAQNREVLASTINDERSTACILLNADAAAKSVRPSKKLREAQAGRSEMR